MKKHARKRTSKYVSLCIGVLIALLLMAPVAAADNDSAENKPVDPVKTNKQYSAVVYDSTNGLPTAVANDIVQTEEGFIWIASYGGLIRYDGNDFERIDAEDGPVSVGCMCVDSQGRLWIGSNDDGVAVIEKGEFQWWDEKDGIASSKVRTVSEDENGNMYVGTIAGISIIYPDGKAKRLDHPKIAKAYIENLKAGSDGLMYGLTSEGDYFILRGEKLVNYINHSQSIIKSMVSIFPDPDEPGMIYIGTEGSKIYHCKAKGNPSASNAIDISPLANVSNMKKIGGNLWICARNGIGVIDDKGFHCLSDLPLQSSVTNVIRDYEGNLWFSSSRQGIMKLTPNRFSNLFERYDIPEQIVNCTCMYDERLFVGTEMGLIVIGKDGQVSSVPVTEAKYASGKSYPASDLLNLLDGCRIRSIIKDSKERLWISTWQAKGLLRFDHGKLTVFDESEGLPSDRVRVVYETGDGSIVVANTGGISFIEGDKVVRVYDENDGIDTIESLTLSGAPNGDIIVGSNGGGIYIIGKKGVRNLNKKDGLTSNVVMRIYYDEEHDVFWMVTGDSLAYMTTDYKITTIEDFPYADNLDIYENSRGEMWVLSSDGIYVVSEEEMIANGEIDFTHYGVSNGLPSTVVSNSYSELTEDGDLYISGGTGVYMTNIEAPAKDYSEIKQAVPFIAVDDEIIYPDDNGEFNVPSSVKKLIIYGYVFNYSLADPLISCKLEGFDRNEMFFRQSELHPMVYTNLSGGSYRYVMKIKDERGDDSKTLAVTIIKNKAFYESVWFYIIAAMALMLIVLLLARLYVRNKMQKLEEQHRVRAEQERVNNELQMASRIQMSMLPHEFPPFPDRDEFDIYASADPAREVGGDFYDYFLIDDDHLCLVIADVSGKGIPASLYMMNSKVVIQVISKTCSSVEEILERVNNTICSNNQLEMFITAWIGILEISTGKLVAANAGHEYPVIKRADGKFELFKDKHGFVLGGMEDIKYREYELLLEPGDKLFLYTDGLPEATDADKNMLGMDRMVEAINEEPEASPQQLLANIRKAVDEFVKDAEQFDDLTMLCLEYKGTELMRWQK